jgi:hypothetical protein
MTDPVNNLPIPVEVLPINGQIEAELMAIDSQLPAFLVSAIKGPPGDPGIHIGPDPPEDTSILWLDTQAIQ